MFSQFVLDKSTPARIPTLLISGFIWLASTVYIVIKYPSWNNSICCYCESPVWDCFCRFAQKFQRQFFNLICQFQENKLVEFETVRKELRFLFQSWVNSVFLVADLWLIIFLLPIQFYQLQSTRVKCCKSEHFRSKLTRIEV